MPTVAGLSCHSRTVCTACALCARAVTADTAPAGTRDGGETCTFLLHEWWFMAEWVGGWTPHRCLPICTHCGKPHTIRMEVRCLPRSHPLTPTCKGLVNALLPPVRATLCGLGVGGDTPCPMGGQRQMTVHLLGSLSLAYDTFVGDPIIDGIATGLATHSPLVIATPL